jgi:amidophosphoribosyltransferase
MQKQHNRGQDGAGVVNVKMDTEPGKSYISRLRSIDPQPIEEIFRKINKKVQRAREENPTKYLSAEWMKNHVPFIGEIYMGHLRYGTHGKNQVENCHPMIRVNNWKSRNLILAGNFNMTNVDSLFQVLVDLGQHPTDKIDTITVLEKIGHFLDVENEMLFRKFKDQGFSNEEISELIANELDLQNILIRSCKDFDGGYAMTGMTGFGSAFVARDPAGIRPAYYYANDEVIVVASEKPAIKTTFNAEYAQIKEIEPGCALIINKNGDWEEKPFIRKLEKRSCSFERIYFSRGTDPMIYQERKKLGELLVPQILKAIDHDLENTVFSYIPNTAETAFLGMMSGIENYLIEEKKRAVRAGVKGEDLDKILSFKARVEKLVSKDVKLRTFISDDEGRNDLVAHVYDTTYEVIRKGIDTVVVIDDSIVRGTTLEKSIINMLEKLEPRRIIIVSSAPQIRYPDCYGIDMSKMHEFVAFRAMLSLLHRTGRYHLLYQVYDNCKKAFKNREESRENHLKVLYEQFTDEEISTEIAQIIKLDHIRAEVKVIYQKVENLHKACPGHLGDWYFTGNYPTQGGNKVVNQAFINYMQGKRVRAY